MIARYGEPAKNEWDDCFWHDDNVTIGYLYFSATDAAIASLISRPFLERESALKKQKAEKGAKD